MHRFFISADALRYDSVALPEDIRRHLKVLRLGRDAQIQLLDGTGNVCLCRIDALDRHGGSAVVLQRHKEYETAFPVELMQALPKGDKLDLVLQKGTELGIGRFAPLQTERSVPRLSPVREEQRRRRWLRIVGEAARQSRRPVLPQVEDIRPLEEAVRECRSSLRLMLWEAESRPLDEVLPPQAPSEATLLIGPEGGFSEREVQIARDAGFLPVMFGPRILRSETAGFAAATILQYRYGDLRTGR